MSSFSFVYSLCILYVSTCDWISSLSTCADFSRDETDKGPPVQMHSLREFEQVRTSSFVLEAL